MHSYDAIVIGVGGVGSAALYQLAGRGARVLGIEQFQPGHDRGSSHGQTRIIRMAYFEHPDYVPLLRRAHRLWDELEEQASSRLYHRVGLLEVGPPDGVVVPGVLASARLHGLDVEPLTSDEVQERFPGFRCPEDAVAVFEHDAGYLLVEDCVMAHVESARRLGAEILADQTVRGWQIEGRQVTVRTDAETFTAGCLILTVGAWAGSLLSELGVPFKVLRKHLHWYVNDKPDYQQEHGCPTFFYEADGGYFYGFPQFDSLGLKVAEHSGETPVSDPGKLDRSVESMDRQRVEAFLRSYLPALSRRSTQHAVCMYTMTPDEHFLVDRHPHHAQVVFAAGLSGHGFKFTPVLGQILADLALDGRTSEPIDFLRLDRPELMRRVE